MAHATDLRNVYVDPISHEQVDPQGYAARSFFNGHTYHFGSVLNKQIFDDDPQLWISTPHASMNSANIDIEDYS